MRKEHFVPDEYFHVYTRGVDKRVIFLDDHDRTRFVHAIYILNNFLEIPFRFNMQTLTPRELLVPREPLVKIAAGCLMDSHFHLLMTSMHEGAISTLLHKAGISYSMYFNKRHERTGRLYESTFKAKHVDKHEYAAYLSQYIHLNPKDLFQTKSDTELLDKIIKYSWSSLPIYLGKKSRFSLLVSSSFRDEVLDYTAEEYRRLIYETYENLCQS